MTARRYVGEMQILRAANEGTFNMKVKAKLRGFSLVELMIVVAIVAILVALALPSYSRYVRKANRGEAQQLLLNWANNQEIWRANDTDYASTADIPLPNHANYIFEIDNMTATTYTLIADPQNDQANDEERGVACDPLTLDQSNAKTPPECW